MQNNNTSGRNARKLHAGHRRTVYARASVDPTTRRHSHHCRFNHASRTGGGNLPLPTYLQTRFMRTPSCYCPGIHPPAALACCTPCIGRARDRRCLQHSQTDEVT